MSVKFEFELGEIVYFKCSEHDYVHVPKKFIVIARIAEETPGGIDVYYRLQSFKEDVSEAALTRIMPVYQERVSGFCIEHDKLSK